MRSKGIDRAHELIIGYGNPLRADDGFGWRAARHLAELLQDEPIEILELNTAAGDSLAHHFTPRSLLAYAQAIFKVSPAALLVSVAGESFGYCEQLTPRVETALQQIIEHVAANRPPSGVNLCGLARGCCETAC